MLIVFRDPEIENQAFATIRPLSNLMLSLLQGSGRLTLRRGLLCDDNVNRRQRQAPVAWLRSCLGILDACLTSYHHLRPHRAPTFFSNYSLFVLIKLDTLCPSTLVKKNEFTSENLNYFDLLLPYHTFLQSKYGPHWCAIYI